MDKDTICENALKADYETTKSLVVTYPEYFSDMDIWKMKLDKSKPVFECVSSERNWLIQNTEFAVAINCDDDSEVSPYFYQYYEVLENVLNLSSDRIHDGAGMLIHEIIPFILKKRFLLFTAYNYEVKLFDQYNTEKEALEELRKIPKSNDDLYVYAQNFIIDVLKLTPWFITDKKPELVNIREDFSLRKKKIKIE